MKTKLALLSIVLTGLLLRLLFFNSSPLSLYGDELTIALDANSLLHTGQDQLGNFMPLTFPMGAGRPAGYVYFSIPFIAIFGPTPLGVRGLSILSGIGMILFIYFLTKKLFSKKIGLIAAGILAVSPWDISLSRGGFEAHLALFLALLGAYLFIKAREKPKLYIASAVSFGLILHTYPTYKVSLLLFLPLLFWFGGTRILGSGKKYFLSFLVVLFILGSLSLSQFFYGGSENRFFNINILSQDKLRNNIEEKINFERNITQLDTSFAKYLHNKPIEYVKVLAENYLQNFSADFLFIHGDRNPRHNMATMGQLYFIESILILIGLLSYWTKARKTLLFLLIWIAFAPIPTALVDLPHALRSSFMLPPLIILSSLGLYTIANQKNEVIFLLRNKKILLLRNKIPIFVTVLFLSIQLIFFLQKLFFLAPVQYSTFWSHSSKVATDLAMQNKNKYDYIILSNRIDAVEFAYPIYARINPTEVIDQNRNKINLGEYLFKKFDNVYIGAIPNSALEDFLDNIQGKILYIGDPSDIGYLKKYETISGVDKLNSLTLTKRGI